MFIKIKIDHFLINLDTNVVFKFVFEIVWILKR